MNPLSVLAGYVLPIRMTARLYLQKELKSYGIDVQRIPQACLQELADDVIDSNRAIAKATRKPWRNTIVPRLHYIGEFLAEVLLGRPVDPMMADYAEQLREIMRRHDVPLDQFSN